jgi:hypothetical protein
LIGLIANIGDDGALTGDVGLFNVGVAGLLNVGEVVGVDGLLMFNLGVGGSCVYSWFDDKIDSVGVFDLLGERGVVGLDTAFSKLDFNPLRLALRRPSPILLIRLVLCFRLITVGVRGDGNASSFSFIFFIPMIFFSIESISRSKFNEGCLAMCGINGANGAPRGVGGPKASKSGVLLTPVPLEG